jgi:hypothetical protein
MRSADRQFYEHRKGLQETAATDALNPTPSLLTQSQTAAFLHIEPRTLESWRQRRIGPRFIRYSQRCVRYRIEDLRKWVEGKIVETASDPMIATALGPVHR